MTWKAAGFSAKAVSDLVRAGELSISWLDAPVKTRVERLDLSHEQLCKEEDVPLAFMQALQEALGFAPPERGDRVREGDRGLVNLVQVLQAAGADQAAILGVVRGFADSLRRVAKAEAELYESEIEQPLRRSGRSEQQLLDFGAGFGDRVIPSIERSSTSTAGTGSTCGSNTASPTPRSPWSAPASSRGPFDRRPSASLT